MAMPETKHLVSIEGLREEKPTPQHLVALQAQAQSIIAAHTREAQERLEPPTAAYHTLYARQRSLAGAEVKRTYLARSNASEQGFLWSQEHKAVGFKCFLVVDDDPRARVKGVDPVKCDMLPSVVRALGQIHAELREADAAAVLNTARRYNPMVGGDGVAMCHNEHPTERGTWSNMLRVAGAPMRADTLRAAISMLNTFVDDRNIRIFVRPAKIVVPPSLHADAMQATQEVDGAGSLPVVVWDQLSDPAAWFLLTSVPGLTYFEREPFELACYIDEQADCVGVGSYERRSFGYMDPRCIVGVFGG